MLLVDVRLAAEEKPRRASPDLHPVAGPQSPPGAVVERDPVQLGHPFRVGVAAGRVVAAHPANVLPHPEGGAAEVSRVIRLEEDLPRAAHVGRSGRRRIEHVLRPIQKNALDADRISQGEGPRSRPVHCLKVRMKRDGQGRPVRLLRNHWNYKK